MDLEQYIPIYPNQDDEDIQYKITNKQEFIQNAASPENENIALKRGQLFAHQKLFVSLIKTYDSMLLMAEPGTGKTISFLSAAEYFKSSGLYRRTYIFERGNILLKDVRKQLACKVGNNGQYNTRAVETGAQSARDSVLERLLKPFYKFRTYTYVVNLISGKNRARKELKANRGPNDAPVTDEEVEKRAVPLSDSDIARKFSGCFLVIDEAHNIVAGIEDTDSAYFEAFHKIVSASKRIKTLLVSATPMSNSTEEFKRIMKFITPFEISGKISNATFEELEKCCRGRISYVKAEKNNAKIKYMGNRLNLGDKYDEYIYPTVYISVMSKIQNSIYRKTIEKADKFSLNPRKASVLIFPGKTDNSFEISGKFGEKIEKFINSKIPHNASENERIDIKMENLGMISCKFKSILQIELDNINTLGTSFIYSEFKNDGGAIILGDILEMFGFSKYETSEQAKERSRSFCDSSESGDEKKIPKIKKKRRFAILVPENEPQHDEILRVFKSPENYAGEYIKIIIGSRFARDGINLAHVVRVHLLTPGFTPSGTIQAIYRALRVDAFDELLKHMQGPIEVKVYKHAAVSRDAFDKINNFQILENTESIDCSIYSNSAIKDYKIKRINRFLKRIAIDCALNKYRNVKSIYKQVEGPSSAAAVVTDDFTEECDYDECDYVCGSEIKPTKMPENLYDRDFSTFDLLYTHEEFEECVNIIEKYISNGNVGYYDDFIKNSSNFVRESSMINVISKLIKYRFRMNNLFGKPSILSITKDNKLVAISQSNLIETVVDNDSHFWFSSKHIFSNATTFENAAFEILRDSEYDEIENEISRIGKVKTKYSEFVKRENAIELRKKYKDNFLSEYSNEELTNKSILINILRGPNRPRIFLEDTPGFKWRYAYRGAEYEAILSSFKGVAEPTKSKKTKVVMGGNDVNISEFIDVDPKVLVYGKIVKNVFKVVDKRKDVTRSSIGRVCSTISTEDLFDILLYLQPDVTISMITDIEENKSYKDFSNKFVSVIEKWTDEELQKAAKKKINSNEELTRNELIRLLPISNIKRDPLCNYIKYILTKNQLIF